MKKIAIIDNLAEIYMKQGLKIHHVVAQQHGELKGDCHPPPQASNEVIDAVVKALAEIYHMKQGKSVSAQKLTTNLSGEDGKYQRALTWESWQPLVFASLDSDRLGARYGRRSLNAQRLGHNLSRYERRIPTMRVCPKCGFVDPPSWRHSRYSYWIDHCEAGAFKDENPTLFESLMKGARLVEDQYYVYRLTRDRQKVERKAKIDYGHQWILPMESMRANRFSGVMTDFDKKWQAIDLSRVGLSYYRIKDHTDFLRAQIDTLSKIYSVLEGVLKSGKLRFFGDTPAQKYKEIDAVMEANMYLFPPKIFDQWLKTSGLLKKALSARKNGEASTEVKALFTLAFKESCAMLNVIAEAVNDVLIPAYLETVSK